MKRKIALLLVMLFAFTLLTGCKVSGDPLDMSDLDDFINSGGSGGEGNGGSGGGSGGGDNSGGGGGGSTVTQVTVYLVPGKGCTIGGAAGTDNAELKLENSFTVTGKTGETLPTPDPRVNLDFVGWCLTKNAQANPVTVFPAKDHSILYGMWSLKGSGGGDQPIDPDDPVDPTPPQGDADLYLAFDGVIDETARFTINAAATPDTEYYLTRTFTVGEEFSFASKAPLLAASEETVYPITSNRGFTLGRDKLNAIHTDDFFAPMGIVTGEANSGVNADGDYWAKTSMSKVECKKAGKYTLYVVVYDSGWVKMFALPV